MIIEDALRFQFGEHGREGAAVAARIIGKLLPAEGHGKGALPLRLAGGAQVREHLLLDAAAASKTRQSAPCRQAESLSPGRS